jgi:biotin carboxyl carrier protein
MSDTQHMDKNIVKVVSPLPGLVARVAINPGKEVCRGEEIVVLNVMKTEIPVVSETSGIVEEIYVKEWDEVNIDTVLATIELNSDVNKRCSSQ